MEEGQGVSMTLRRIIVIGMTMTAGACGGGSDRGGDDTGQSAPPAPLASPPPAAVARPYPHTDQEIADLIYSGTRRTPTGFYSEAATGASSATITHLKNTHIATGTSGEHETTHELCTDDWSEALEWSEIAATKVPTYGDLVGTLSESRYFEFVRVPRGTSGIQAHQRVFRCTYLDRTGTDLETLDGSGGRINQRPLTATGLQQLAEYLWHFTPYNNFGNVVLTSAPDAGSATVAHGLTVATLERASAPAHCDLITIQRWTHAVDPTGAIARTTTTLGTLKAREAPGHATLCEN